jgi:hypothetical protein
MNKELKKLFAQYNVTSWANTKSGHYKFYVNDVAIVCSSTPSHQRVMKEIEGDIKRVLRTGSVR